MEKVSLIEKRQDRLEIIFESFMEANKSLIAKLDGYLAQERLCREQVVAHMSNGSLHVNLKCEHEH